MLHHDRDGIARRIVRRVPDKERMIAAVPRQVLVAHDTGEPLGLGDVAHLRRAGLAGHGVVRLGDARASGGAAPVVHHIVHAPAHELQMRLGQPQRRRILDRDRRAGPRADEPGHHGAPRRQPRRHDRELQRRREDETLPDACIQRVADEPRLVPAAALPGLGRHQPAAQLGHGQLRGVAEAKASGHLGDPVDAHPLGDLVIVDVAGLGDAVDQVHVAVPAAPPAMKAPVAQHVAAIAEHGLLRRDHAVVERGERDHHLEGRPRRVHARRPFVVQRAVLVLQQRTIVGRGDPAHEKVGIKARRRSERQHVAGAHVHQHRRGGLAVEPLQRIVLQRKIEGQVQVGAGLALLAVELADHPAQRVDLDAPRARLAPHLALQAPFQPALSDLEFGDLQHRVAVVGAVEILLRHPTDIADHVGRARTVGVVPAEPHLGLDAGQRRRVDVDAREGLPRQVLGDHHRHEGGLLAQLLKHALAGALGDLHHHREPVEHGLGVTRLLAHDHHAEILLVDRERQALAVEHLGAGRGDQAHVDAVLVGQKAVVLRLHDLELAHPPGQPTGEQELRPEQDDAAPRGAREAVRPRPRRTPPLRRRLAPPEPQPHGRIPLSRRVVTPGPSACRARAEASAAPSRAPDRP